MTEGQLAEREIFDDTHEDFRETVREFLRREAAPRIEAWEKSGEVDRSFWRQAAAQNLVAFAAPTDLGGLEIDDFRFNVVLDEEAARLGCLVDKFNVTNDIVLPYLLDLTSKEQRRRWLPGIAAGTTIIAVAMSEPGAGSDLRAITTTATRDGDGFRLSGSKTFITSGLQADLMVVAARTGEPGELSLFVVEAGREGFERGRKLEKIGRRATDTAELFLDDAWVPEADMIGELGRGLEHLKRNLAQERLSMAVTAIAGTRRSLETTLEYVRERTAFGRPVGSFQANRHALAELHTEAAVGQAFVDRCVMRHVSGKLSAAEAAAAKLWGTELEWRTIDRCLQLHGGYGYMEEYEIARRWRDARVQRIYGGTSEIMREIVGRSLGL